MDLFAKYIALWRIVEIVRMSFSVVSCSADPSHANFATNWTCCCLVPEGASQQKRFEDQRPLLLVADWAGSVASIPLLPSRKEIIGGLWTISQNQPTRRRRSHRRPRSTTDEELPQPSELFRSAGPHRATRCDLWWARYLPPWHSRLSLTRLRSRSRSSVHRTCRQPGQRFLASFESHQFLDARIVSCHHRQKFRKGDAAVISFPLLSFLAQLTSPLRGFTLKLCCFLFERVLPSFCYAQRDTVIVRPQPIDDVLQNPNTGITTFNRFNGQAPNPGAEVV